MKQSPAAQFKDNDLIAADRTSPQLGDCVRSVRQRLDLTLTEVHERTGIAISTLSKVENNLMSLTYDKIVQFAEGLGVDIAELFSLSQPQKLLGRKSFTQAGEGMMIVTRNYDYAYVCADLAGKKMAPIIVDIRARTIKEFGPLTRHSGEEFGYVIRGTVALHSDLYKPVLMPTGSSIYFDARMGHAYVNAGRQPATILCMCTAPESELTTLSGAEAAPAR